MPPPQSKNVIVPVSKKEPYAERMFGLPHYGNVETIRVKICMTMYEASLKWQTMYVPKQE